MNTNSKLVASEAVAATSVRQERERAAHAAHAARAKRRKIAGIFYPVIFAVAFIVVWDVLCRVLSVPAYLVPAPLAVVGSLVANGATLWNDALITLAEIVAGFALSIAVGIPIALGIFASPTFERTVYPALVASQAMPKVAIAPLLIVWFGFGFMPKVMVAFLVAFFPIVINTVAGLAAAEPEKIVLARSMGLSGVDTFFKIRLPNALANIFAGLKIAITLAVVGAVVGEFVGGNGGLGYQLLAANGSMDTPLLFAVLFLLTALGVLLFVLVEAAEHLFVPKHISVSRSRTGGGQ